MNTSIVKVFTLTAMCGLLAGCVQPNGEPNNTTNGAIMGGMGGAAIGALADRRNPGVGALIGAGAGLLAGGLIGNSVDRENAARERALNPPLPPPPSLADIKALARSGVSDDVIINQINSSRAVYHLDASAIIDLNRAGVSQKVITYMINSGENVVATQSPPPVQSEVITAAPGPDYIWVGGEWVWSGGNWVWVGPSWERGPHGWYRTGGHWR